MRLVGLCAALLLTGCGASAARADRFAPGTWQLEASLEGPQGSARVQPDPNQSDTVQLSAAEARFPPSTVFFTHFYHGAHKGDIRFDRGRVSGSFEQPRVDDIAGHNVPITGTYARDRFRVSFTFKAFGMDIRQVVEGRLVASKQ